MDPRPDIKIHLSVTNFITILTSDNDGEVKRAIRAAHAAKPFIKRQYRQRAAHQEQFSLIWFIKMIWSFIMNCLRRENPLQYGIRNEPLVIEKYEKFFNTKVFNQQLQISKQFNFSFCSLMLHGKIDGMSYRGIIEVKSRVSADSIKPRHIQLKDFYQIYSYHIMTGHNIDYIQDCGNVTTLHVINPVEHDVHFNTHLLLVANLICQSMGCDDTRIERLIREMRAQIRVMAPKYNNVKFIDIKKYYIKF